ncbi:MAG: glycosyltransferase family 4 protein [Bacteroidia bacterium]|nr:glycosyltransferase family 4 protein [Bacteroidia bacterium]
MRILFLVPYPENAAPSQRFRFEQYLSILEEKGHSYHISPFLDKKAWSILYLPGHWWQKTTALIRGTVRRFKDIISLRNYDVVFIHREAEPFGPPLFEWLIMRVFKMKTVYDFDDAIWIPNASESNSTLTRLFKKFSNVQTICKWATKISVGNKFLMDFASRYNSSVHFIPTTIDTELHHNAIKNHKSDKFVFGWTGSHSTIQYLDMLVPVFQDLEKTENFELLVICDIPPKFNLKSVRYIPWKRETEIEDLLNFNVGLMPLPDDIWAQGKCGFKALQYMALGIPAVVSDVGVNAEVVDHEKNGCVCKTVGDWAFYLKKLLKEPQYLQELSGNTREKIVKGYSVQANKANFIKLFEDK